MSFSFERRKLKGAPFFEVLFIFLPQSVQLFERFNVSKILWSAGQHFYDLQMSPGNDGNLYVSCSEETNLLLYLY